MTLPDLDDLEPNEYAGHISGFNTFLTELIETYDYLPASNRARVLELLAIQLDQAAPEEYHEHQRIAREEVDFGTFEEVDHLTYGAKIDGTYVTLEPDRFVVTDVTEESELED